MGGGGGGDCKEERGKRSVKENKGSRPEWYILTV